MHEHHASMPGLDVGSTAPWQARAITRSVGRDEANRAFNLDDSRLRTLRESAFAARVLGNDHFGRFWFRDLRRLCLFLTLMRESAWLRDGELGCFTMAHLSQQSRMSVARVYQVLSLAKATGDFEPGRDPRDARLVLLEPSPAACEAFDTLVGLFSAALSAFLDRPDPLPRLARPERRAFQLAFIETVLAILSRAELDDRQTGSTTFLLAMLDLWLHSPVGPADFVRREAVRLQVTQATMRNVLHRAERTGFIARLGRRIRLTEAAQHRVAATVESSLSGLAALLARAATVPDAVPGTPAAPPGAYSAAPQPVAGSDRPAVGA